MNQQPNKEFPYGGKIFNGFGMLAAVWLLIPAIVIASFFVLPGNLHWLSGTLAGIALIAMGILSNGFFILQPNQARVMIFFGKYCGTYRNTGYFWVNPFMTKKKDRKSVV